ncbi:MAG: MmgE/PrpD family protein [Deltaproteobacteria bacterium]|nr:MmgE/PrpD family protein [Deltaproteobacteria bacterium]
MEENRIDLTRKIARFIVNTNAGDIPQPAVEHAKVALMDWIAVTLAGKDDPLAAKLVNYAELLGGREQATVIGYGIKKNISQAALINGAASHALDFDDTLEVLVGHPTVTLYPALLALAEWQGLTGRALLAAYLIGLKTAAVIAQCGGMEHYMHGWHGTSTIGHFASAAGCSKLLGLNEQQTVYALGIAGTQASGLKSAFGTMCKPFHAGKASQAGLMSALLASDGFTGADNILEGTFGFLEVLNGKLNKNAAEALDAPWEAADLAQKYHASCHATHSPIEGTLAIIEEEGLNPDDIKSIKLDVSELAIGAAGKTDPQTGLAGKFSISYCVANALLRGDTGTPAFTDEKVNDPQVKEFMKKISLARNDAFKLVETIVELETTDGKKYSRNVDVMKDIPDLEKKKEKITAKLLDLSSLYLDKEKAAHLVETINRLDKIENVQQLAGQL